MGGRHEPATSTGMLNERGVHQYEGWVHGPALPEGWGVSQALEPGLPGGVGTQKAALRDPSTPRQEGPSCADRPVLVRGCLPPPARSQQTLCTVWFMLHPPPLLPHTQRNFCLVVPGLPDGPLPRHQGLCTHPAPNLGQKPSSLPSSTCPLPLGHCVLGGHPKLVRIHRPPS